MSNFRKLLYLPYIYTISVMRGLLQFFVIVALILEILSLILDKYFLLGMLYFVILALFCLALQIIGIFFFINGNNNISKEHESKKVKFDFFKTYPIFFYSPSPILFSLQNCETNKLVAYTNPLVNLFNRREWNSDYIENYIPCALSQLIQICICIIFVVITVEAQNRALEPTIFYAKMAIDNIFEG